MKCVLRAWGQLKRGFEVLVAGRKSPTDDCIGGKGDSCCRV